MQLKIYQQNAIDELLEKAKRLLGYPGSKKLVFKSPTGSGKTIMMAEFLKQLVDDNPARRSLNAAYYFTISVTNLSLSNGV